MSTNSTPYTEVSEVDATIAGLPGQPDTTYRDHDGETYGYNAGTLKFWKLGRSPFPAGAEPVEVRERSPIGRAIDKAQAALEAAIAEEGGRVLCAVMIVHAADVSPSGGVDVSADDDGPKNPEDVLSFALTGVSQLAERYGLPFAVMDVPATGGQG